MSALTLSVPTLGLTFALLTDTEGGGEGASCLGIDVGAVRLAPGGELLRIEQHAADGEALRFGDALDLLRAATPLIEAARQAEGIEAPVGGVGRRREPGEEGHGHA